MEYRSEKQATNHELKCYHNEVARACVTCGNFKAYPEKRPFDRDDDSLDAECCIHLDRGGDYGQVIQVLQNNCSGWVKRTAAGTYKYGREMLEVES